MAAKRRQGRSICMRQARFVPPAVNPAYLLPNAPRHSRSACSPVLRASHSAEYKSQCGVRRPLPCVPPSKPHSPLARVLRPASPHFQTPSQQTALPARTRTAPPPAAGATPPAVRVTPLTAYCAPSRHRRRTAQHRRCVGALGPWCVRAFVRRCIGALATPAVASVSPPAVCCTPSCRDCPPYCRQPSCGSGSCDPTVARWSGMITKSLHKLVFLNTFS